MEQDRAYFITSTVLDWKHLLKADENKDILISEWRHRVNKGHLKIYAFVIMPNHYHAIVSIPSPFDPSDIIRDIHKWTSRQIISKLKTQDPFTLRSFQVDSSDRECQIWERNYLPVHLFSPEVFKQKLDYIHNNPLQDHWNLASIPEDYVYSSARFYLLNEDSWDFLSHFKE